MDMVAPGCITSDGYRLVYIRQHWLYPKPTVVLEHRFMMECFLGRRLTRHELVHHKDENHLNNAISNLEIKDRAGHILHHAPWKGLISRVSGICQYCGGPYEVQAYRGETAKYCQESCRLAALHEGLRVVRPSTPCEICGTMIEQGRYTKKYCDSCRATGRGQAVSQAARQRKAG